MWMTCAGSLVPNLKAKDTAGEEAAEGTVAHSLAEVWLKNGEEAAREWIGTIVQENGFEIEVTEEMFGYVGDYIAYVEQLKHFDEYLTEQKLKYGKLVPLPDQGGTGDHLAMTWQELVVTDLKYGKGVQVFTHLTDKNGVITYRNYQLRIYALLAFLEHDWLYNFQNITIRIAQPRLDHFQELTLTREEIEGFALEVEAAADAAFQPNAPRTPSAKACQWCKIKGTCSAAYLLLADETEGVFTNYEDEPIEGEVISKTFNDKQMSAALVKLEDDLETEPFGRPRNPADLSTYALANLLRYQSFVEKYFSAIRDELLTRAISDEEDVIFWKLVEARTRRKFVDDEELIVEEMIKGGLDREDCFETKMISPARLEKKLHHKAGHKLKAAAKLLEALVVKPPGQKTLVQLVDKRSALPSDGDVFTDYTRENL